MGINTIGRGLPPPQQSGRADAVTRQAPNASNVGDAKGAESGAGVASPSDSTRLSGGLMPADTSPPVDMDRLQVIASAIEDGSYQVDPEQVAAKILAFEADLKSE